MLRAGLVHVGRDNKVDHFQNIEYYVVDLTALFKKLCKLPGAFGPLPRTNSQHARYFEWSKWFHGTILHDIFEGITTILIVF